MQSLLISTQNRRLHLKLGWSVLIIAPMIAVTGPMVALRSLRLNPNVVVFDWPGRQFLLILYSEIAMYTVFVTIGVLNRRRPRLHRPMMLLASLTILSGATDRIPLTHSMFGSHGWVGFFGPVVSLAALLLAVHIAINRRVDRELAFGCAALAAATAIAPLITRI